MDPDTFIRAVSPDDAEALLEIYSPYVLNTAVTFEYAVPSLPEFRRRIETTLKKYPYLAAQRDGRLLGYAYTNPLGERPAYGHSAETSIYLRRGFTGAGLGHRLYEALEAVSRAQNIINLYACVAFPETEDEYLTLASPAFHKSMGYAEVGKLNRCGFKFGRWYGTLWMEKVIGVHSPLPAEIIPFPDIPKSVLVSAGITI